MNKIEIFVVPSLYLALALGMKIIRETQATVLMVVCDFYIIYCMATQLMVRLNIALLFNIHFS